MSATTDFDFGPDVDPTHDPVFGPDAAPFDAPSSDAAGANGGSTSTTREDLPVPDRAWRLFCQGESYSAIARALQLDRHTVARYVKQIHDETQADRRADRSLALTQALGALAQIQATAWDQIKRDEGHERVVWDLYVRAAAQAATQASSLADGYTIHPPTFHARTARLLTIILAAIREVARLELLYAETAPARDGDAPSAEEQDRHLYIMMRHSDQEALAQLQRDSAGGASTCAPAESDASPAPTDSDMPDPPAAAADPDTAAAAADVDSAAPAASITPTVDILDANGNPPIPHVHPKPDLRPDGTDDWYVHGRSPLSPPPGLPSLPGQPPRRRPRQRTW